MQLFSVGYSKKGLGGCAQPPRPFLQRSVSGLLSARRPGHIPAGQYMEMQMLYTLPRLLLPMGLAPLGTHIFILGRSRSALRVSPPHRGGETAAQRRRPIFDGAPGSRLLSARRPSHIPAGQYMEMQMLYTLPRLLPDVGDHAVAVQSQLPGHLGNDLKDVGHHPGCFPPSPRQRRRCGPWG